MRGIRLPVSLCAILACGCATYQFGTRTLFPPDVSTVYVPIFESASFRRNLGERLTEAVAKRIEETTPYKVVGGPHADSILSGRIVSDTKRVLVENRFDEAREIELNFAVEVSWVRRGGQMIGQPQTIPVPPTLIGVGQTASLVPEGGQSIATAQQEAIDRLATQIVSLMEVPW